MSFCRIGVLLLYGAIAAACSERDAQPQPRDEVIPVVVEAVQLRTVPVVISAIGSVESAGGVAIQSRVDGTIVRVMVEDGADVKAGEPLVQIDPKPFEIELRRAKAVLARAEANLDYARTKETRGRSLLAQRYIADDEYNLLKTNLAAAAATLEQDRAAVDDAQLKLDYTTIKAPVAGRIGHVEQQVGNMIHASAQTPLTTLNVLDPIEVSFAIPERQLALVQAAMTAGSPEVRATRTGDAPIDVGGALTFIDNAADATTGTIRLRARFANSARVLWPGQFVTATLKLPGSGESIVVPSTAIANGPDGTYVYVVVDESIAQQRAVQVARTTDAWAIVAGVRVGERVVVDGQLRLYPDARVVIHAADRPT